MIRLIFLCLLFLFGSCEKTKTDSKQVVRFSLMADPTQLDPRKARTLYDTALVRMLFEGLTRLSQQGDVELALADRVDISEDGVRYVFHLKESKWSNGTSVTAFDFCESWKAILDPQFATDIASQLYCIKNASIAKQRNGSLDAIGVKAIDEKTLVVELEHPIPYFLQLLSMTYFFPVPSQIAKESSWALSPKTLVSNGPFSLNIWKHSDHLTLVKNPHYWEASSTKMNQVDILIVSDDTAFRMYEEGKLDWMGSPLAVISPDAIKSLKEKNLLSINPFLGTYFYRLNTALEIDGKKNPLSDARLRRLLSQSIDRKAIVEHVLQGGQTEANSLVPPAMGLEFEEKETSFGIVPLKDPLTITYINTERNAAVAQAVKSEWEKKLGLEIAIEAIESKTFFQLLSQGKLQIAAGSWSADFDDPINFLEVFKYSKASTNNTGWENADYVDILNRSDLCKMAQERKELLRKAEAILMKEAPIIPIFHFSSNYMKNPHLVDAKLHPLGVLDFRWASFEDKEVKR